MLYHAFLSFTLLVNQLLWWDFKRYLTPEWCFLSVFGDLKFNICAWSAQTEAKKRQKIHLLANWWNVSASQPQMPTSVSYLKDEFALSTLVLWLTVDHATSLLWSSFYFLYLWSREGLHKTLHSFKGQHWQQEIGQWSKFTC